MHPYYILSIFFACLASVNIFGQSILPEKSGKYTVTENYKIWNYSSPVELTVKTVCSGAEAEDIRESFSSKSRAEIAGDYAKYYAGIYPGAVVSKALLVKDDVEKNEVVIIEQYSIPEFFHRDSVSGSYDADFYSDYVYNVLPKFKEQPKQPLQVGLSDIDHTIVLDMAGGWNIDMLSEEIKNKVFQFNYDVLEADNKLTLHFRFKYLKEFAEVEEIKQFAGQITEIKESYLTYSVSHFPDSLPFYPNWSLIISGIFLVGAFAGLAYIIYHKTPSEDLYSTEPRPLGGWLFIVVIGLLATVYNEIGTLVNLKYLDLNTWDFYSERKSSTFYKMIIGTKVFTEIYVICFALFCLFLMYKQRDILPKIIAVYFASSAILMTILHILFTRLYGDLPSTISELTYLIVSSFIGMYYFKTAERVKETFIVPVQRKDDQFE